MAFDGLCLGYPKMRAYGVTNLGRYNRDRGRRLDIEGGQSPRAGFTYRGESYGSDDYELMQSSRMG